MGIVKGIFGTKISGKVGQVVFRTRAGKNVVSEKPANVKNPRSFAQQAQRMCMATASAAYRGLKVICDHSFEGVTYGADSMALFMRENLNFLKTGVNVANVIQYNAKGNQYVVPNRYLVSKGSLPTFTPVGTSVNMDEGGDGYPTLQLFENNALTASTTVAQLHTLLGFDIGDQITVLAISPIDAKADVTGVEQQQTAVYYARLIFKKDSAESNLFNTAENEPFTINSDTLDLDKSENYNSVKFSNNGIGIGQGWPRTGNTILAAMCIIRSKQENGVWKRSTQYLIMSEEDRTLDSTNYGYVEVTQTYDPSANKYLNNADD